MISISQNTHIPSLHLSFPFLLSRSIMIFSAAALMLLSSVEAATVIHTHYATQVITVFGGAATPTTAAEIAVPTTLDLPEVTTVALSADGKTNYFTLSLDNGAYVFVNPSVVSSQIAAVSSQIAAEAPTSEEASAPAPTSTSAESSAPAAVSSAAAANNYAFTGSAADDDSVKSSQEDGFKAVCVDYHNKVRATHQAPALEWNDTLASFASDYLDGNNCVFEHSGGPYGENLAIGYPTVLGAMEAWYNENKDYDYAAAQFSAGTGHFTQMVWKATGQLGCATRDCSGSTYLVCEYSEDRGNIIGYFDKNVLSPN